MRITQRRQQQANLFKRELTSRLTRSCIELGHHGVELFDGYGVRHGKTSIEELSTGIRVKHHDTITSPRANHLQVRVPTQTSSRPKQQLQRFAGVQQAVPSLIFRQQTLVNRLLASVVYQVSETGKACVNAGE